MQGATEGATATETSGIYGRFSALESPIPLTQIHQRKRWTIGLTIRNQQVASSILAGGSMLNHSKKTSWPEGNRLTKVAVVACMARTMSTRARDPRQSMTTR